MFDSAGFNDIIQAAFMRMKTVGQDALKWFENELKLERENIFEIFILKHKA